MGGFPYLIFSKGDRVSAAASVGDGRSPLATIAPLEKLYIILKLEIPLPLRQGPLPYKL